MAEILIPGQNNHQLLFYKQNPIEPSASSTPFLRGPMYSAYAQLRDSKLRLKKTGLSPSSPIPAQVNRPAASAPVEEKPQRFNPSNPEMRRMGSMSAGKGGEKRGGPVLGGRDRADEFLLMRSFSGYQESASRNEEDGRRGRAGTAGILRKTFTGFRRSTAKATGWIG